MESFEFSSQTEWDRRIMHFVSRVVPLQVLMCIFVLKVFHVEKRWRHIQHFLIFVCLLRPFFQQNIFMPTVCISNIKDTVCLAYLILLSREALKTACFQVKGYKNVVNHDVRWLSQTYRKLECHAIVTCVKKEFY